MKRLDAAARRFVEWRQAAWVVLGAGGALFVTGVGQVRYALDDSSVHVANANTYLSGLLGPDNWWTTPLKHLLLAASIAVFGDDPVGWRMRNVLAAAGVVALVFVISRALFQDRRVVLGATLLAALDPAVVNWARSTTEDLVATLFVLIAFVMWLRYRERGRTGDGVGLGAAIGVAVALRWSAAAPALVLLGLSLFECRANRSQVLRVIAYQAVLPLAVYVLPYLPWMARGHDLGELLALHADALRVQSAGATEIYRSLSGVAGTRSWLVRFVGVSSTPIDAGALTLRYVLLNNPLVWTPAMASSAYLAVRAWKRGRADWLFVAVQFPLIYGVFALASRPFLLYSAPLFVPFAAIALAYSLVRLARNRAWLAIAAFVGWDLYLLPLTLGLPVPPDLHAWLLAALSSGVTP